MFLTFCERKRVFVRRMIIKSNCAGKFIFVVYSNYYLYLCTRFASKGRIKADIYVVL